MSDEDLFRKEYRELSIYQSALVALVKDQAASLHDTLMRLDSREGALARTKLEEAVMWATKAIT